VTGPTVGPEEHSNLNPLSVRFAATDGIRVLNFEDESIVFNPTSWDAHLLNAAAAAVLESLADGPRSVGEIEVLLREALRETEQADATEHARRLLHEFEQLGLVHSVMEEAIAAG
jgi:PqqD family protein of HPr-rel-A system